MTRSTFADGDRLYAADVQAIQDQAVLRFADDTERDAQYPSPDTGALIWLDDPGEYQTWDGADWQTLTTGGGATALDDLTDVNAPAPDDGDVLTWDDGAGEWINAPAPGGGALSQAYVGYDTIGGSTEVPTTYRIYAKRVTLAAAALLTDVQLYLKGTGSTVPGLPAVGLWTDNAGTIGDLIAAHGPASADSYYIGTSTGRWVTVGSFGRWLAAGDYWVGFMYADGTDTLVHYDGSGSDRRMDSGGNWLADGATYTQTDTTNKYSIRAGLIS